MDNTTFTFTSNPALMNRRSRIILLEQQLVTIRSLMGKEGTADDDDSRDVIKDLAKKGVTLNKEQLAARSTELLLTVLLDLFLLRLLDEGEERGATGPPTVISSVSSDQQQLMDDAAAAKKKQKTAAKKKRNKRNKAAKHKKTMSWLRGGIISLTMVVAFGSIATFVIPLSLIHHSDGSGEGKAPPALPPSASRPLRQDEDLTSDNVDVPNIISSPVAAVVPPPVFSPTVIAVVNRHMKSDEKSATMSSNPTQSCVDTPGWKDHENRTCDWYNENPNRCLDYVNTLWEMGSAKENCDNCGGGICNCEDYRSKCKKYINVLGIKDGVMAPLCEEAESCSCEAAKNDVEIVTNPVFDSSETAGLYNVCKCDFWSRLCEDTGVGEACDYAAEYCCGDYVSYEDGLGFNWGFFYLESPECYCDFFNYAQEEFGHTLKSKALNTNQEIANPCGQFQDLRTYASNNLERLWIERGSLVAIYTETSGQDWTNNDGWDTSVDYCQWYGISCDVDGYVTSINLRNNNLGGQFPVYTGDGLVQSSTNEIISMLSKTWVFQKYGLANLYNLKSLDLAENKLTGTIDYRPIYNLYSLTHFDVSGNQLSGDLDALVTASLTHADFSSNRFTSLRFKKYKGSFQTLRFCDVSNNFIQIDATNLLKNTPHNIDQFFASNNEIHGSLPMSLNNLPNLRQFDMSSNALSGEIPQFADSMLSLQELDISNQTNGFTGSISEDLWRFQSLQIFNLAGNKVEGTIPPTIGNMAVLKVFDLSDNLLRGTIPSELGVLDGTLKRLGLSNNVLSGMIPSQLNQLHGAVVILEGNHFHNKTSAPLSLCMMRRVEMFDLKDDVTFCPVERNALSDFYDSAKGAEWTDGSLWQDEYESYCAWKGVTCESNRVTKLNLTNNGLSGRLSESIGNFTFIEVLDLSDNHMKGSIPTEIGLLSKLTYLRLSYNAFTGTAPEGLVNLTKLQLLQLQSNRITEMPHVPKLDESTHNKSTFVTDCGVPSAFDEALECEHCTMCCNAKDDCYPQEKTAVAEMGLTYGSFAVVLVSVFIAICCMVALSLYLFGKRKNRENAQTMSTERRLEEDDNYALSRIGKDSVYSYFVTDMVFGWLTAFVTLGIQVGILAFFIMASEANLQEDTIDIQFTWKCPRDSDVCKNTADLSNAGWFIFSMLMVAFLAKDMINGSKLLYHSSESRHNLGPRIRYFIGGMCLCSITLFALYVSTVYNKAIATSNTDIIVNSVIVLFIMEIDEYIFAALEASNKKWTAHADESEDSKEEFELQRAQIESQQEQIDNQQEQINDQQEQITDQQKELRMLREMVEKIQESQAAVAAAATASDSESAGVECGGSTNIQEQQMEQVDQIAMPCEAEENTQESKEADEVAATSDLLCESDKDEALQE